MTTTYIGNAEGNAWLAANLQNRTCWLALHTDDPTPSGNTGTEVLGGGYERQRITFGAPSNKSTSSTDNQTFSGMPACTVTWVAIWSDQFAGRMIAALQQGSPQGVGEGGQYLGAAGDITIGL